MYKNLKQATKSVINAYGKHKIQKHGFWFIDIPRTSSSSIRVELEKYYGIPYGEKNIFETKFSSPYKLYHDHLPGKDIKRKLGVELWNQLFTFTFVRNPWDRILSFYYYRLKCNEIPSSLTFREYISLLENKQLEKYGLPLNSHEYKNCADYILDENNKIDVNYVAKYETREKDLNTIAKKISCSQIGNLHLQKTTPPGLNFSKHFDIDLFAIIEKLYLKDITLFNYSYSDTYE